MGIVFGLVIVLAVEFFDKVAKIDDLSLIHIYPASVRQGLPAPSGSGTLRQAEPGVKYLSKKQHHPFGWCCFPICCLRLPAGFSALNGPQQSSALPQAQQSEYRRRNA